MAHDAQDGRDDDDGDHDYKHDLRALQIELVKLQRKLIASGARLLIIIEGRDGAGKDGTIKRLIAHMAPRETRVFAPGVPSSREEHEWYFQRFVPQLPAGGEVVIFNRSWYNRAGVERVMGFCTEKEVESFFDTVVDFESLLVRSAVMIRKYYLDIGHSEQKKRLKDRKTDPLSAWKNSPIDAVALKKWNAYTEARDEMLRRTSHTLAPWHIVKADDKKTARLALMRNLLHGFSYPDKKKKLVLPDGKIVFQWSPELNGDLAN